MRSASDREVWSPYPYTARSPRASGAPARACGRDIARASCRLPAALGGHALAHLVAIDAHVLRCLNPEAHQRSATGAAADLNDGDRDVGTDQDPLLVKTR